MTNLYVLAHEYRQVAERLANMDLDDATIADTLESMSGDLETKAQNTVMFCRNLESTAAAIKEAEAQMAARRKAIENRATSLRKYVKDSMDLAGVTKIESPYFRLTVQNNPPSVDVFEPGLVPMVLMASAPPPPPTPDKKEIARLLKLGHDVPGCRLTQSQRLVVS